MSWQIGTNYKLNDVVTYEGSTYKCILEHVSHDTWKPSIFSHAVWQPLGSSTPVITPPVITAHLITPPVTPIEMPAHITHVSDQKPVTSGRNLSKLLNGKRPLAAYYQSWSMPWSSSTNNELSNLKHANIVYISFASPNCTYKRGQMSFQNTGLSFSSDFQVIKDSIAVLQARGVIVMLSVGGATYQFDANYNADGVANLVKDLNCNGIDVDWENHDQKAQFGKYISETRRALGDEFAISAATFSIGAYGEGIYANAQPPSAYTGMSIAGLKSNGHQLDWINIMSYDASDAFDPLQAYDAHKALYKGPLLIGAEVPPEAWGGHVINLDKVKQYVNHVKKDTSNIGGLFVWSYNKQGTPNCNDILTTAIETFGPSLPVVSVPLPTVSVTPPVVSVPAAPMSPQVTNLVGKTLLGFQFFQDTEGEWARIDNTTFGESEQYSYKTFDGPAGDVLDEAILDTKVVAVLYEWATGKAYSKTGFDLNNTSDVKYSPGFTTFVVKSRVLMSTPVVELPTASVPIIVSPPSQPTVTKTTVAPYIDVNNWPPYPMSEASKATGNLHYTLAFILDDGRGNPAFGGTNPLGWYMDEITKLRAMGGDCIISFGGANGTPLAVSIKDVNNLVTAYQKVIDMYKCKTLDFDVEGGALNQESVDRRNQALVILQRNNPTVKINYTLPVMPDGLDWNGLMVIKSAKAHGLSINCLNLMAMDYGQNNQQMGQAAISAGKSVKQQLVANGYPTTTVGLCPMIGKNDTAGETFSLNNAREMLDFVKSVDYVSLISFWSMNRDITQANDGIGPLYANSSIKQNQYDFVNIFKGASSTILTHTVGVQQPPATAEPSVNLLGKVVLGSTIIQDGKESWLKLDGVVIGDTFNYQSYNSGDIGGLLDQVSGDPNVTVLLYNWKTGEAYSKTGFDFNNSADTKINADFTSFIVKDFVKVNDLNSNIGNISISSDFVKWQNGQFTLSGTKFVPVGLNCYFLGYTEWHQYPTKAQIEEMFIVASKMKATVIRSHTLGSSNGHPKSLTPTSSTGFNNAAWDPIDYSFSMAKKYGIKLIIPLCDAYEYFHGSYGFFTKNRGVDKTKFWTDRNVINDFKSYITTYLNHVNPYTGVAIKNSPEVCMIELGNELGNIRPTAGSTSIPTESWTREITQHIKSIDKTHLVLDGCDEALSKSGSFNVKEIDVYTSHFYWLEKDRIEYGANTSANLGKPYIIGEYSSKFGLDWYNYIESRTNIKGSIMWCIYCHEGGYRSGAKVPHNDGFAIHYPEDSKELLLLTNHFRRMRGMSVVNSLEL